MNQPRVYMCSPHPKPLSHLPPHSIPLGCPSAPALSALFHALNLDWSVSHIQVSMGGLLFSFKWFQLSIALPLRGLFLFYLRLERHLLLTLLLAAAVTGVDKDNILDVKLSSRAKIFE